MKQSYKTSNDFRRLVELLDAGETIAGFCCGRVFGAEFFKDEKLGEEYGINLVDGGEIFGKTAEDFIAECQANNVLFIDPADCSDKME